MAIPDHSNTTAEATADDDWCLICMSPIGDPSPHCSYDHTPLNIPDGLGIDELAAYYGVGDSTEVDE